MDNENNAGGVVIESTPLLAVPSDTEIGKAARQFSDDQGTVPTAFAFQEGARWAREMQRLRTANNALHVQPGREAGGL